MKYELIMDEKKYLEEELSKLVELLTNHQPLSSNL